MKTKYIHAYTAQWYDVLKKNGLTAPEPQPYLHICTNYRRNAQGSYMCYAIFVWDTREVVASGRTTELQVESTAGMHISVDDSLELLKNLPADNNCNAAIVIARYEARLPITSPMLGIIKQWTDK